jgi:hypothetical protein
LKQEDFKDDKPGRVGQEVEPLTWSLSFFYKMKDRLEEMDKEQK